jgi:hypothetical protein
MIAATKTMNGAYCVRNALVLESKSVVVNPAPDPAILTTTGAGEAAKAEPIEAIAIAPTNRNDLTNFEFLIRFNILHPSKDKFI